MITQYQKGRYFEWLVSNWLTRNNYVVSRAAGSHGLFDVIAIPKLVVENLGWCPDNIALCIQIKSVAKDKYLDSNWIHKYINQGSELCEFRKVTLANNFFGKYVMIFNKDNKKHLPYIFYYEPILGYFTRVDENKIGE